MLKNLIVFLLLINTIPEMFAQAPPEFVFNRTLIVISDQELTVDSITIFKGEITENNISNATPILGKTLKKDDQLHFTPMIPLGWNQKYTLVYNHTIKHFTIPVPDNYIPLSIIKTYPTSTVVPSNILKWYIKFSKPINTTHIYNHIKLTNTDGDTLSRAILPLENALVSEDGTLLTVWVEPGRQKRGLGPNEQLGPVFKDQKEYKLSILNTIKDQNGVAMLHNYHHSFLTKEADRKKPTIDSWKLQAPSQNSFSKLLIKANEPLDYGSSIHNLNIVYGDNDVVGGHWELLDEETTITFIPLHPWKKGSYTIIINSSIEDLAGNNLNRLFDSPIDRITSVDTIEDKHLLEFKIK